jgi:protein-S-isoprenylcysteine O-methyltransferase Ste14
MVAAALIPLMFILGLVVLFVMGAWPMSWLPGLAVLALLVGLAVGLSRMLTHLDHEHTPH